MVANRRQIEASEVHRRDRGFVEEVRAGERRGVDQIAGGNSDTILLSRSKLGHLGSKNAGTAGGHGRMLFGSEPDSDRLRRLEIAVKAFDREDLDLHRCHDRGGPPDSCRLGSAAGQGNQRCKPEPADYSGPRFGGSGFGSA